MSLSGKKKTLKIFLPQKIGEMKGLSEIKEKAKHNLQK